MLPREFTEEQVMFRDAFRKFLSSEIVPHMEDWREAGVVDREAFRKAGEQGFLMVWPDEKYGGMGDYDIRFDQIIIEETCYARCADWFANLHGRLVGPYLTRFGSEEQCERFLPKCVSGETILAIAMTEPDAGSDLAGMRSYAVEKDDHWVLNGSKTYISNGINADVVIVAAKTDPENNPHAMTLFLVERGMEGFERGRNLEKMGMKAQDTAELFFNDVKVPKANVLGEPGKGFIYLMEGLAEERLLGMIGYLGAAQLSWDLTLDFVKERKVFGKSLSKFQNTQFKLAELRTELDHAQVYTDQCVRAFNAGQLTAVDAAKGKLYTSELQVKVAMEGVQLHGGAGYMDEYPISRQLTDAMIAPIYAGSSEVMKIIVSRDFLGDDYQPFNTRNF
ncbi:acyl-CoA dehydrogenase family protein [Halioglobus pacificus]|uniref:Acyl-CoA dehydrogenase n=1 Tax=Parahalioglobus pacificus TaxID=930806 RepID=A0A918XF46_9GAMM|nr:acyl-CoA dehydrogenase family protein [Halioglobus pacificus]NQY04112.1 acyl-CoA dehydrogenase family protein [Halieaceae bacterium]GHD27858.1 acyl-CoA dehydrogenase [Halioglobus pacificus]